MKLNYTLLSLLLLMFAGISQAQVSHRIDIEWESPAGLVMGNDTSLLAPSFRKAQYPGLPESILPSLIRNFSLPDGVSKVSASISEVVFAGLTDIEKQLTATITFPVSPEPRVELMFEQRKPRAVFRILPFGIDPATGATGKVVSFTLTLNYEIGAPDLKSIRAYAENSVLSSGDWYKIYINESGVYKLTWDQMQSMGINLSGLNPELIRIFGNGGDLLEEAAGEERIDDLAENAIKVVTANPGSFLQGDYVLFYGKGTQKWTLNPFNLRLDHTTHFYADQACYFVTIGPEPGKRIQQDITPDGEPNYFSDKYTAYAVYEEDNLNLIKSGRKWFSDKLDNYTRTLTLPVYQFPDMDMSEVAAVRYGIAGRATAQLSFNIIVNDEVIATNTMAGVNNPNDYARELMTSATFNPASTTLKVEVKFNPPNNTALGWVDYVALNVRSNLRFTGGQLLFSDPKSAGNGRITSFTMTNAVNGLELWEVTDPTNVKSVEITKTGDQYNFRRASGKLNELLAFDGTSFLSPVPGEKVVNQNLHATGNYDMIIIAHPEFAEEAERLAMLHNNNGDVSVTVISLPDIYNEFSSGIQDITAIRDFMKMLYDRGTETAQPQYMLLFGNSSYDVKDRTPNNSCFIPTFQSDNSVRPVQSFLTDDYFGLLDDGEGANQAAGLVDVASGRLIVRTKEQAKILVDKIEHYLNNPASTHGDWRNSLIVVADDENKNTHLEQAEGLTAQIERQYPVYNVEKIYFDAYKQVSTPGGSRYPDVNREIVTRVEKGAILTNYIGHGGEVGWADERVLELSDINGWTNYERMGLFFTATCEFSRFDNPAHTSAGELVFLNPNGGAMSLITTTRLAYASTNAILNLSFIDTVFKSSGGEYPRLGDILRHTKNDNDYSVNSRHITLFGDPSLRLPYPKHKVVTTAVLSYPEGETADTLFANSLATVEGEVHDYNDQLLPGFNGVVYVKVYDKASRVRTLGQDTESYAVDFKVQKSILYQGKASVTNGKFSFTFPVPRDIDYSFGRGKISYYATNGTEDAQGFYKGFLIGGSLDQANEDLTGPDIQLYINDTAFTDGDYSNENPKLIAYLHDNSGINTVGNGIGHDLVATIDGDSYNSVLLNDYYVSNLDSYQAGMVNYQYFNLPDGEHTLTLKAWDVFNNSSSASITFNVKRNIILAVDEVKAYPNPSAGEVWFSFGHNQFDGVFTADMEIYTLTGVLVRTIGPLSVTSEGYVAGNIKWDGCTSGGQVVRNGMYVCRLKLRDRNDNTTSNSVKVILSR